MRLMIHETRNMSDDAIPRPTVVRYYRDVILLHDVKDYGLDLQAVTATGPASTRNTIPVARAMLDGRGMRMAFYGFIGFPRVASLPTICMYSLEANIIMEHFNSFHDVIAPLSFFVQ
jgi:hypothetical protein